MAQQTGSTDTDTAADTATNTVAKCDRMLLCCCCCPAGRGSCPTDLASHARREKELPCRFGGCHQIIFKCLGRWAEGGGWQAAGMACGFAKNKGKWRRPRREFGQKKGRRKKRNSLMTLALGCCK